MSGFICKIKVHIVAICLLLISFIVPAQDVFAFGITTTEPDINRRTHQMVGYWDLRERNSFFQVTNTSGEEIRIHIQLFNVGQDCAEFDYYDTLTGFDTHVYKVSELDRNNGAALASPDLSEGHGIVAVSLVNPDDTLNFDRVLTGNFRIQDSAGYEYRTNFVGSGQDVFNADVITYTLNFNDVNDSQFADIVVISYIPTIEPGGILPTANEYNVVLYDDQENPISCSPVALGCPDPEDFSAAAPVINTGINQAITNSHGGPSLCLGTDTTGFINMFRTDDIFIGPEIPEVTIVYTGLNTGNGSGSMTVANQKLLESESFEECLENPQLCDGFDPCLIDPLFCEPPPP